MWSWAVRAYYGSPIADQIAEKAEIIVHTPGQMIDLLTAKFRSCYELKNVHITYVVLDKAYGIRRRGNETYQRHSAGSEGSYTVLKQMYSLARETTFKITFGGRSVVAPGVQLVVGVRGGHTKFNRSLGIRDQT